MFLINDVEFKILPNKKEEIKFKQLLNKYTKIKDFLLKHNILKDVCLDNWEDKDFNKLEFWMNAIENNKPVELGSNISLVGSISIKDIRLSIFAKINSDKKFDIASLWNNDIVNKYHFKYQSNQEEIETNNFYLVLNSESYQSDDINAEEMKNSFGAKKLTDGEYTLMNLQALEVIKAYDITKSEELLQYSKYLMELLLKYDPKNPIFKMNYFQILKREDSLTDKEIDEIINIRDANDEIEIKLGCNLLIDNIEEVKLLTKKLDTETLEAFKQYPISIYMN